MPKPNTNLFAWDKAKQQEKNLIQWIEALLSGNYKWGRFRLYNPKTDCHCANGVALQEFGFPQINGWFYLGHQATSWRNLFTRTIAPYDWFEQTFGRRVKSYIVSLGNDRGLSYAETAAQLVKYLPDSEKKADLMFEIAEQIKAERAVRKYLEQETQ